MTMTKAMAERVEERVAKGLRLPPDDPEKIDILMDWLRGDSLDKIAKHRRRGIKLVRAIVTEARREAETVLSRPGDGKDFV